MNKAQQADKDCKTNALPRDRLTDSQLWRTEKRWEYTRHDAQVVPGVDAVGTWGQNVNEVFEGD